MKQREDFCHSGVILPPAAGIAPGIMPLWSGHQRTTSPEYRFDGMHRGGGEVVLWQYTLDGCGAVEIDGATLPVRPGEAFLLTIPERHCYYLPTAPGTWEFIFLGLGGPEALRLTRELRRESGSVSARYGAPETVQSAWRIIRSNLENSLTSSAAASTLAYTFMMSMVEPGAREDGEPDILHKLHQYCLVHLARDIPVADMAAFAGYSRSHFCRVFRERTGKSPHEYLLELRMQTAMRKLQHENLSVKEAAENCGFADSGYFCRVFRRFYGATPARFRLRSRR
ncbi:MAG: AraC family transcriptional regulator [Lentisphaeria bacterium]|nr:AraC family transcriptional regulator [Lentisphaeria bacterium]